MLTLGLGTMAVLSVLVLATSWRVLDEDSRRVLVIYAGCYAVTYLIGGVWIGLTAGEALRSYLRSQRYTPGPSTFDLTYWLVLWAPFIVPPLMMTLFRRRNRRAPARSLSLKVSRFGVAAIAGVTVLSAGFALWRAGGVDLYTTSFLQLVYGNSGAILEGRFQIFGLVSSVIFGLIYSGLPALSHVAIASSIVWPRVWGWRLMAWGIVLATALFLLATFQLAPFMVYLAATTMSLIEVGKLRPTPARLLGVFLSALALLQIANTVKFGEWSIGDSLFHLVMRMPSALPYYLDLFPGTLPYSGYTILDALNPYSQDPGNSFIVARTMYPRSPVESAQPAPAHVDAYADFGVFNVLGVLAVIGALLAVVARWRSRRTASPLWHALYIQGLVMVYYLTQTSLRGSIWDSMGLCWSILPIAVLRFIHLPQRSYRLAGAQISRGTPPAWPPVRSPQPGRLHNNGGPSKGRQERES
jgi:hypothetical protein